jgi:hypothetical protein
VLLTLAPVLVGAAETGKGRPVAWLALRSYQRLEQRLREISTMAKTPGLADMMLGMVQLQLAGLGGLDRQRPIGVVVPTVSLAEQPPVAVVLPYTERDAILQTLRSFFPQSLVEDGGRLSLQGGPMPAFGRLDAQANVVIVSTAPEIATSFDVALPADLFGTQEGGPDLVLRVDVDALKQQLDTTWNALLAGLEQSWQAALQNAAEDKAVSPADQAAMTAYMAITQKGLRQFLEDLFLGEIRLSLAPTGWLLDVETKMRPGSASAAFLNAQAGHMSRATQLFAPGAGALLRLVYNVRMTDALRQDTMALFPALRQMLESRLAALPALTQEQHRVGTEAIATYFSLLEQWYAQKELEAAAEMRVQGTGFELTSWLPFTESARALSALLDIVEKIPLFMGEATAKVTRDVAQHQGTALHRIDLPTNDNPELPNAVFVAAQGAFLAFHLGSAPPPLQGLLDRMRQSATQAPVQTDALMHMEMFLVPMLQLGMSKGQVGNQDPMSQALLEKLRQGPDEPFRMDVLTRHDAATVRTTFPGVLIQSAAEVMGQQITQQMRGGGEQKSSPGDKKSGAGKSRK